MHEAYGAAIAKKMSLVMSNISELVKHVFKQALIFQLMRIFNKTKTLEYCILWFWK